MIRAAIVGDPNKVPQYILKKFPEIQGACRDSMARLIIKLTRKIKEEKLSGQVLKNQSGTLRRSIIPLQVSQEANKIIGIVASRAGGKPVEYAAIHEFGGKTPAHEIRAKRGKALYFKWEKGFNPFGRFWKSDWMFFKKVQHPGSVFPERSFMRTALEEMRPEILQEFQNAIMEVVSKR